MCFWRGIRDDIENEDDEESYYRYMEENPTAGQEKEESEGELEYDEDGNPIAPAKSKVWRMSQYNLMQKTQLYKVSTVA